MHDIISNLDGAVNRGRKQTNLIIMDFAKAFDKVPHRMLLHKLEYYGIRGYIHRWINLWLSGYTQQVVLDCQASYPVPVPDLGPNTLKSIQIHYNYFDLSMITITLQLQDL